MSHAMDNKMSPQQSVDEEKPVREKGAEDQPWMNATGHGPGLQRKLKGRHIQMIAIGSWQTSPYLSIHVLTISRTCTCRWCHWHRCVSLYHEWLVVGYLFYTLRTGLFLRTAQTLAQGGPGGLFLGYAAFSTVCVCGAFS